VEELRAAISGKLAVFTGNSGVGKSSLLNRLSPGLALEVGEVSEKLGRGRHTTRCISLYHLDGGTLACDTPGFSAFDTDRMDLVLKEQLPLAFPDFKPYLGQCQFPDCVHRREPRLRRARRAGAGRGGAHPVRELSEASGAGRDGQALGAPGIIFLQARPRAGIDWRGG
jgi:ribosome biogenesis GTPase